MAFQYWLGDGIWSVSCIQSLADNFLIFHKFFEQKIEFSNFLPSPKFSVFSMPVGDAYHLN